MSSVKASPVAAKGEQAQPVRREAKRDRRLAGRNRASRRTKRREAETTRRAKLNRAGPPPAARRVVDRLRAGTFV